MECSFCDKSDDFELMFKKDYESIAVICNECVEECAKILAEERMKGGENMGKKALDLYEKLIKKYEKKPETVIEILAAYCRIKDDIIEGMKGKEEK